jgi:hypothetical protein
MIHRKTNIVIAAIIVLITSCEEVINMDLNESNPRVVIECSISDKKAICSLFISKSGNYFDANSDLSQISGAKAQLTDNEANTIPFKEIKPGLYQTDSIVCQAGRTYLLKVDIAGSNYEARNSMPTGVNLDSAVIKESPSQQGNPFAGARKYKQKNYFIRCYFADSAQTEDYYWLETKLLNRDTIYAERFTIQDDKYLNGTHIELNSTRNVFIKGDLVLVTLNKLNKASYDYLRNMNNIIGGNRRPNGNSLFDNPPGNISNNALGFFMTSAKVSKVVSIN